MRPSQQRYHTSLEKYHVGNIATNRKGKKKTENKLHVRDSIKFNILSINKWSKKMENMHKKGVDVGGEEKNGSKTTTKIYRYICTI